MATWCSMSRRPSSCISPRSFRKKKLLTAGARARAEVYRWILFAVTELEQPLWRITRNSFLYPEDKRDVSRQADIAIARGEFAAMAQVLEAHLQGRAFYPAAMTSRRRIAPRPIFLD